MAVSFNVPASPARSILTIDEFLGVDFTNGPANVEDKKSPNSINMIRDIPGKVRKCMGYETIQTYVDGNGDPVPINGYHTLRGDDKGFLHAGTDIFWGNVWLYDSANNARSKAWQFEKKLYMLDGKELLVLTSEDASESAYTNGVHTRSITTPSFTENVKLKENDFINFYLPYECEKVVIVYTDDQEEEQTIEVDLDDATTYLFNNTYGDYEFALTFYASYTYQTIDIDAYNVSLGAIGKYSECSFTFESRSALAYAVNKTRIKNAAGITVSEFYSTGTHTWTSQSDEEYTLESDTLADNDRTYIPDSNKVVDVVSDTSSIQSFKLYPGEDITFLWSTGLGITASVEMTYTLNGETHTSTVTSPEGTFKIENTDEDARIYSRIVLTFTGIAAIQTTYHQVFQEGLRSATIKNTHGYTYEGELEYIVNGSESAGGFIDGRSGSLVIDGVAHAVSKVSDNAYIPLVTISKDPEGGGTPYEDLNLLTPAFTESFLGKPSVKDYNLSFAGLDETVPIVEVMDSEGEFQPKTYGTDFTVDYEEGIVTFITAPGESPLTGEDNVKITAYRTVEGYADRINKCTIGTLFGVSGALDRLFVSGNPDFINYDWYSGQYDPTYFTDTSYSMLGTSASAIVGYSIISNYLAAHKDWMERDQNIILREGDLVESEPSFRIINTLQGAGAVAPFSFAYLETEPLFLTRQGIYAVTAQDISGEKYAQNRSYFIDGKLLDEPNLEKAYGFVYKDMYWLCLNDVAYILDGLQPLHTDKSKPYATRQYAAFYRTNLPARVMWEENGRLFFGTEDGRVCRFYNDKYAMESYNDDGEPITAMWETPDIDGKLFYKNKTLRYVALRLDSAIATSVSIWVQNRGIWQFIKKDDTSGRYLSFSHLVFSKLGFSGDITQHTIPTKVRVKKVDKFRLRVMNDDMNEPFGLFNIAFEYVENGNYKG